jgi:hypothetical protein
VQTIVAEALQQHIDHCTQHQQRHRDADGPVLVVEIGLASDAGAREHHTEQEQDHDRADVHRAPWVTATNSAAKSRYCAAAPAINATRDSAACTTLRLRTTLIARRS